MLLAWLIGSIVEYCVLLTSFVPFVLKVLSVHLGIKGHVHIVANARAMKKNMLCFHALIMETGTHEIIPLSTPSRGFAH